MTGIRIDLGTAQFLEPQIERLRDWRPVMARSMNRIGTRAKPYVEDIRREVLLPVAYARERIQIRRKARENDLRLEIVGRKRATSLRRFASSLFFNPKRPRPVRLHVKAGGPAKLIRKGFFLRLRNGNIGLAIRLKEGQRIRNKKAVPFAASGRNSNIYLLYGPSVDQVLRVATGRRTASRVAQETITEFRRLYGLVARGEVGL